MRDLNSGLAQVLEEINDLAAQRRISEGDKYHFTWLLERAKMGDEVDRDLLVCSVKAEIRNRLNKTMSFDDMMGGRPEQKREKRWQEKVKQERRKK